MSNVTCYTSADRYPDQKLSVLAGWDPALKRYFLVLDSVTEDQTIYCNLDEPNPDLVGMDTTFFRGVLARLGVTVPDTFWATVELRAGDYQFHEGTRYKVTKGGTLAPAPGP